MSIAKREPGAPLSAPGRPVEIEDPTNRYFVHPTSRALVDRLLETRITPNQISVSSVFIALGAAFCILKLAWPWTALGALPFLILGHVFDGADGDLARRTGRASPSGELIDGICDHASQLVIYFAVAFLLQRTIGPWLAWTLAWSAGAAHFVQANAYETGRKTYRRWVYGAPWMRQTGAGQGGAGALARVYLALSNLLGPGESQVESAMDARLAEGEASAEAARRLYGEVFAPLVKRSAILGANARTMAIFACLLVARPAWYFLFELTILNAALIFLVRRRASINRAFVARLRGG
jgi:phosphatidylglycerophosphate synthase